MVECPWLFMKRPRVFFFVVAWHFFGLLLQASSLARPSRAYRDAGEPVPFPWSILPLLALVFVIWQIRGLLKLKVFHRWFAVFFFTASSVLFLWNLCGVVDMQQSSSLVLVAFSVVVLGLNLSCAWYLSRRSFREFANRCATERKEAERFRTMQKFTEKRIRDEFRN